VLIPIIDCLATGIPRPGGARRPVCPRFRRRLLGPAHAARLVAPDDNIGIEVVAARGSGLLRLLAGMVRANSGRVPGIPPDGADRAVHDQRGEVSRSVSATAGSTPRR